MRKTRKIIVIIFIIIIFILLYELIGILVAYGRQPKVSAETMQSMDVEKYYKRTAGNEERAAVIEENADALLQRIRLIYNAQEEIVLSTFAFHSDESGKIVIGALSDAAERGVKVRILADGFESWTSMEGKPYFYALSSHDNVEIKIYNKANPLTPWKSMGRMHDKYLIADGQTYLLGGRNTYNYFLGDSPGHKNYDRDYGKDTFETENITLVSNPIHTQVKEPVVWYELGELMKNAKQLVVIHTPYIIFNEMMYDTWREIAAKVPQFSVMTNSAANNGNPFGSADYDKNRDKILDTGVDIWEYEGGYSYHGKSILIDDEIPVIGSFNMDMRSAYLDTELMLVINSRDVNKQLEENMKKYEMVSRQVQADGTYQNPYDVKPIELTGKRKRRMFLVRTFLGWSRFLF